MAVYSPKETTMAARWLCAVMLSLLGGSLVADESHGWAVVYLRQEVDPTRSYLMYCPDRPECNTVYQNVEMTKWFSTRDAALDFVNGYWVDAGPSSGPLSKTDFSGNSVPPTPMIKDRIIGIFECKRLSISLHKVGKHRESVQETVEKEVDTLEWRP
jgi:hypothetical protein